MLGDDLSDRIPRLGENDLGPILNLFDERRKFTFRLRDVPDDHGSLRDQIWSGLFIWIKVTSGRRTGPTIGLGAGAKKWSQNAKAARVVKLMPQGRGSWR